MQNYLHIFQQVNTSTDIQDCNQQLSWSYEWRGLINTCFIEGTCIYYIILIYYFRTRRITKDVCRANICFCRKLVFNF